MSRRTPRRVGRRLAITDEGRTRLLNAIRAGTPVGYAAEYAGVGQRTLFRYLARGEDADARAERGEPLTDDDEVMRQIWQDVSRARADVAVRGVALIQRVASGGAVLKETTRRYRDPATGQVVTETERTFSPPDAKPIQWLLERTHRQEFGKTSALEVTGADGGPVQVDNGDVVTTLAARLAALTAERRQEIEAAPEDVVDVEVVEDDAE
jgi:hypothetical protein